MASEPLVLGFDTSAAHCAAALLRGDRLLASRLEEMTRGQAERLMPLLEEVLDEGGAAWQDLDAIGVGVGPGNFTGIRIAVSAARGLALGLDVPAVGVDGFEARAADGALPAVPAPRDQVYAALPGEAPRLMPRQEAEGAARGAGLAFTPEASAAGLAEAIARIAAARFQTVSEPPAPLYLRAADAAPSSDVPPALIDE
ncbi:tRNA (adenosine(37)-N6)-threonylcarbamoyltransferase complex dimerization subunit type 1 TsaB [Leisingera daeponensis]|uniref:tRNA (Adenosine(37)-N6)-threonylcarbamoyltransferase complex dimerization subunit type 1 TsaB n=1 Tax=Leisingera daeponensis TaxID=405746 RepID=A0ABS7NGS7_9RHOB|nr:tRNA (adenosine(37)-N6)-threonylcarbamoyltransferase complex dimerization subunit type 1 TsaB [Leisingera daeponensis]MBY6139914.1 tRNA (adenosine(37)-N6)-threonylcarbamoyltransferase complex dimerization subunit type 1 TsaB [Leisingera daeponensis]